MPWSSTFQNTSGAESSEKKNLKWAIYDFPGEYKDNKEEYVNIICEEMIPQISEQKLAVFCDVFCEEGYFSVNDSRKILETAKLHRMTPRLHAD